MRISAAFPSKYVKASDLGGRKVRVIIDRVAMERPRDDSDEMKPVVYFTGTKKGLVLNKTNANTISDGYGDDTDRWHGQAITLIDTVVDYQGKSMAGIRVVPIVGAHAGHAHQRPLAAPAAPHVADAFAADFPGDLPSPNGTGAAFDATSLDDEIPF